jgi:hypothetical protein
MPVMHGFRPSRNSRGAPAPGRPRPHGGIEQRLAGGDATDNAHHLRPAFDLQAVGAVIGNFRAAEVTVGFFDQGAQGDGHERLLNIPFRGTRGLV